MESGTTTYSPEPEAVEVIFARILIPAETAGGVKFRLDLSSEYYLLVRADVQWLRQAFDSLVDNALEAMVDSTTKELKISTQLRDNGASILIQDTGHGIPVERQPLLLKEPIKKPTGTKGTGMGPLLAQTIVQTYGGKIPVQSTGPAGTTMSIWLPLEWFC